MVEKSSVKMLDFFRSRWNSLQDMINYMSCTKKHDEHDKNTHHNFILPSIHTLSSSTTEEKIGKINPSNSPFHKKLRNSKQEAKRATYRAPEYNVAPFWRISQGGYLVFRIDPKNTNLVEDIEILLPVKFRWIPFSSFRGEVENVSANLRGGYLVFTMCPKNTNLVETLRSYFL